MVRTMLTNAGNRLLSQRVVESSSPCACNRVSCSEPDSRRRSLMPDMCQPLLTTVMKRGAAGKGISRVSTAGARPRSTTSCCPGATRIHSVRSGPRITCAPTEPSMSTASGLQPCSEPGNGIATSSVAWMRRFILTTARETVTLAATISAQFGTQSGGSSRRDSSWRNSSGSGVCADTFGLANMNIASIPAAIIAVAGCPPMAKPPGNVQRRLKISAANTAVNSSSMNTSKKRSPVTAQRGRITSRIV